MNAFESVRQREELTHEELELIANRVIDHMTPGVRYTAKVAAQRSYSAIGATSMALRLAALQERVQMLTEASYNGGFTTTFTVPKGVRA